MKVQGNAVYLSLKVQPRASRNEIGEVVGNELKVKITAPPVDSAANEALVRLIAEKLGCSRNLVQLTRGATSQHKIISVMGIQAEAIVTRLGT